MIRTLRTRSATVRPTNTAERAMGIERNRSTTPRSRSSARPTAVCDARNATDCTKMPGSRKSTYFTPPGSDPFTAPPKTYANSSTNMIGWIVEKMRSCGWRMKWRRLRPVTTLVSTSVERRSAEAELAHVDARVAKRRRGLLDQLEPVARSGHGQPVGTLAGLGLAAPDRAQHSHGLAPRAGARELDLQD